MWISSFKPNGTLAVRPNDPSAHRRLDESQGVGAFGVKLFLASLSFLFAASILLYLILLVPAEKPEMAILPERPSAMNTMLIGGGRLSRFQGPASPMATV